MTWLYTMNGELEKASLGKLVERAYGFLEQLVGPPIKEIGELLSDQVRLWRFKNQVNILLKAEKFLKDKEISPRKVPIKMLVPLINNGSLEENEDMQLKWASLLANAANPNYQYDIHSSYVEILKELSPLEAKLLDKMFDEINKKPPQEREELFFDKQKICTFMHIDPDRFNVLVDNLFRLSLLQPPASHKGVRIGKYPIVMRTYEVVQLTALGYDFVRACRM